MKSTGGHTPWSARLPLASSPSRLASAEAPPRRARADIMYELKNAIFSVFLTQPRKINHFLTQGGETTSLGEPDLLSYSLSSQTFLFQVELKKNHFQGQISHVARTPQRGGMTHTWTANVLYGSIHDTPALPSPWITH